MTSSATLAPLRTIAVRPGHAWPGGLTEAVVQVATELGSCTSGDRVAVVVEDPPREPEKRGALLEAMRSLVHASVLERPSVRVNLVYGGSEADRHRTLEYVRTAYFLLGATMDLGGAR